MRNRGTITGLFSGLFWGIGLTISGYIFLTFNITPFLVSFIHDFISIIILGSLLIYKNGKINFKIFSNVKNYSVVLAAILAGPVGMQLNLYAVKYIGVSLTSSVTAIYPAIAVLLSIFLLKHKVNKSTILGVLLIVAGLFLQTFEKSSGEFIYVGLICALLCACAWASESVLSSYAMNNNLTPLEALFVRQVTSLIIYSLLLLFNDIGDIEISKVSLWLTLILLALSNMISYLLYYITINDIQPSKATGLNVTYVIWSSILAYFLLGADLTLKSIVTSLIIIGGIYTIIRE